MSVDVRPRPLTVKARPTRCRPRTPIAPALAYLAAVVVILVTVVPFLFVFIGGFRITSLAALKAHMAASASGAFTGMHLTVNEIVAAGNKPVVRFTYSGTQTGPRQARTRRREGGGGQAEALTSLTGRPTGTRGGGRGSPWRRQR